MLIVVEHVRDERALQDINRELLALEVLDVVFGGLSEREAVKQVMRKYKVNDWKIRGAIHALAFEVIRRLNILDRYIYDTITTKQSFNKLDDTVKNILRIGVYEIKFTEKSAALVTNEMINITHNVFNKNKKISRFINALLRKIEKVDEQDILKGLTTHEQLALKYNYPTWLVKYIFHLFDDHQQVIAFLEKGNEIPPTSIRVNTLKASKKEVIANLLGEGFEVDADTDVDELLYIKKGVKPITWSKLQERGHIYIQSKSSILVPHVLSPQQDEIIFDLCASPGGKTSHLAQLMQNRGKIYAFERSSKRILELKANLNKMGVKNSEVLQIDSRFAASVVREKANKILLDAPCTGIGTIFSRPSIKWKFKPRDSFFYTAIQFDLLQQSAQLINQKGIIVYSTCSILYEENELVIGRFLKLHPEFKLIPFDLPNSVPGLHPLTRARRLYPHLNNSEGFFIAKLEKRTH